MDYLLSSVGIYYSKSTTTYCNSVERQAGFLMSLFYAFLLTSSINKEKISEAYIGMNINLLAITK